MDIEIKTERIQLTAPRKADAEDLYNLRSHPDVNKFIQRVIPTCIADAETFIAQRQQQQDGFYFIIRTQPAATFAGAICLWNIDRENNYAEVGYELLPHLQGKGIMTNALREIIHFAFTAVQLETVEAFTHAANLPSRKLLERFGFKHVEEKTDPDNEHNIIYCLTKAAYRAARFKTEAYTTLNK